MKLSEQRDTLVTGISEVEEQIDCFLSYIHSDKFQGYDPRDGQPNDYVRVGEVNVMLQGLRSKLQETKDEVRS